MPSFIADHPMLCAVALILIDIAVWRLISPNLANWKLAARLVIFAVFSVVLFNDGMNPMQAAPYADDTTLHLAATALQIGWWLFAARTLTVLLGAVMMQRVGHTGRLLQDLMGAVIFLIAIIAAMAYVLDLPVKGVLATSGAVAIIVGLALQSTLSDVFSGIVLNTTKPYQIDDWISIDGTEGRVTDIDWRATRLQTSQGSLAVIPNSLAAKAKIINFSRPADMFGLAVSLQVSPHARPQTVIEALERAFSQNMTLHTYRAGEMILAAGEVSDHLFIIESGVVSVLLIKDGHTFEAGRMGPGEVIGESGILSDQAALADFSAKTYCTLYRIENEYLKPCLDARHDIGEAMKALLDFRRHAAQALTEDAPVVPVKKGFIQWLRNRGL